MKKNNIDDVLSLIRSYNDKLLLDKDNNQDLINILEKIEKKLDLTEDERKKIVEAFPEIEEIIKRIYVINQLRERGFVLDGDQLNVLSQFVNMQSMVNESIEKKDEAILINDELRQKMESKQHIDSSTLEMLKNTFLDKFSILGLSDRIKLLEEIINYNSNCTYVDNNSDVVEEHINKNLLSEEDIRNLLNEYDYSYDDLDEDNKLYLRKHCNLDSVRDVLNTLKKYNIKLRMAKDYENNGKLRDREKKNINLVFCKILAYSSPSIIDSVERDFEDFEEITFAEFVRKYPNVFIPNVKGSHKTVTGVKDGTDVDSADGEFNNYKDNREFFISKKFNFESILKTAATVLLINSNYIKTNYEILEKIYNVSFVGPNTKKDGLYEPRCLAALICNPDTLISNIDRYIESSIDGYEYANNNPTEPRDLSSKLVKIYRIRLAEKANKSVFYNLGKRGIVQYSAQTAKDDELRRILNMSLKEAQEEFDSSSKDSDGNFVPRQLFDDETIKKYKLLVTDRKDNAKEWDKDEKVLSNEYINYLENNCRIDSSSKAYDFIYNINGTIISRKKVLRIFGQLMNPEVTDNNIGYNAILDDNIIKYAISYESILNEDDVNNIEEVVKNMSNSLAKVKSLTGGKNE